MITPKRPRPLLLTGPYLAMWLWLLVPFTLHGLIPLGVLPPWTINLHAGAWIEEVEGTQSIGEALNVMRLERRYTQCRYARFDTQRSAVVLLPPNARLHCRFFRLTRPAVGYTVNSITHADAIEYLIQSNR